MIARQLSGCWFFNITITIMVYIRGKVLNDMPEQYRETMSIPGH